MLSEGEPAVEVYAQPPERGAGFGWFDRQWA